jgi:fructose-1-phosphate kinase PfkB-like protein
MQLRNRVGNVKRPPTQGVKWGEKNWEHFWAISFSHFRKKMSLICLGSLNLDTSYSVPNIVKEGETILSSYQMQSAGGKGTNQSIAIARVHLNHIRLAMLKLHMLDVSD